MDNGVDQTSDDTSIVETITGGKEFRGSVEHRDPQAPRLSDTPRPDHIPEKFWDPVKGEPRLDDLLKSYTALESKLGGGGKEDGDEDEGGSKDDEDKPQEKPEGDTEETDEGSDGDDDKGGEDDEDKGGEDAPLASVIDAAREVYAETGELSAEAREPLRKAGITDEQIDFYLAGVKATENAIHTAAVQAAGSQEELDAAMQWAATAESGWTDKERIAFNNAMADPKTIKLAVPGLMEQYRAANPSEGKLTNINSGGSRGDVYTDMEEFQQDLQKADQLRDGVARRKAVEKLRRSRAAKSIKRK